MSEQQYPWLDPTQNPFDPRRRPLPPMWRENPVDPEAPPPEAQLPPMLAQEESPAPPKPPEFPVYEKAVSALTEKPIVERPAPWYKELAAAGLKTAGNMMPRFAPLAAMGANEVLGAERRKAQIADQQLRQKNLIEAAQLEQGKGRILASGTAERNPYNIPGEISAEELAGRVDAYNKPIQPGSGLYYRRVYVRGQEKLFPVNPTTRTGPWQVDPNSPTGMSQSQISRYGARVGNVPGFQPSAYPRVTQGVQMTTNAAGQIMQVPVTSTSTPQIPGLNAPSLSTNPFRPTMPGAVPVVPPSTNLGAPQSTPPSAQLVPTPGARAGTPTPVAGAHAPVTDATRNNWESLNRAMGAYEAFNTMAKDFVKGSGVGARARGLGQWAQSKLGQNDEVTVFNNMREGLRSLFSKFAVGSDVGNLSIQEQQWILDTMPKLGMTEGELKLTYSFVMDMLLRPRMNILNSVMQGRLDPAQAQQATINQQAKFGEQLMELQKQRASLQGQGGARTAAPAPTGAPQSNLKPRTPGTKIDDATVDKYLGVAGQDPVKAKQMAVADGWDVSR
jgi:hypothetical protein